MTDSVVKSGESPAAEQGWTPRLALSLASIVLLLEVLSVSYIMVSMAMPLIAAHYETKQGAWLLTAFLLVGAVSGPLIGKLADMYGKRRLLLACVGVAAAGSFLSAIAPNYATVIAGRALSGVLIPCVFLGYALIRDIFPAKTVALSVSIVTSGLGLIAIPAPFLTGWFIDNHGFRSIFWFFTIAMLVFGAMIYFTTPESSVRLRSGIDFVGAVLLGAGIAGILIALSFGPTWGWKNGSTLTYLFAGIALVVAWIFTAGIVRDPLVDLSVLRQRPVYLTALGSGLCYGCSALFTILLPMMAMTPAALGLGYGFGVSSKGFAIFQAPIGGMVMVGGVIVGILVGRNVRPRLLMVVGMVMFSLAFVLTASSHTNKPMLLIFCGLAGTGMGLAYAAVPNLLIEAVPPSLLATTASIVNTAQSVVASILPVIAFSMLNNSYIAPFPPEVLAQLHGAVLYTDEGFHSAFLIGAVAAGIGAVLALLIPRRIARLQVPTEQIGDGEAVVLAH